MKTAVSLPDQLFAEAEAAARELNINRSQLYARALEMFLAARQRDPVTDRLNELVDEFGISTGTEAGRLLIERGLWEW